MKDKLQKFSWLFALFSAIGMYFAMYYSIPEDNDQTRISLLVSFGTFLIIMKAFSNTKDNEEN